jgi:hypothetical protein
MLKPVKAVTKVVTKAVNRMTTTLYPFAIRFKTFAELLIIGIANH